MSADPKIAELEQRLASLEAKLAGDSSAEDSALIPGRKTGGSDAQLLKKVSTRLQDFEAQITAQLSNMQGDFDKKLSHVNRGASSMKPLDAAGHSAGLDTMAEDLDQLKYDVGELKDLLSNNKGEVNHIRRIVLACERDMEDFTAAMDAVNVDLDEMRARVDSTHSIITSRQRVEATVTAEISTMRLDMGDMQEALKAHDAWMEDVSQSLQEAHGRCHQLSEDTSELREQTQAKLDAKTDMASWSDMNDDVDSSIKTVRDMCSALRLEVDSRRRKVDEALNQVRSEIKQLDEKVDTNAENHTRSMTEAHGNVQAQLNERLDHCRGLEDITNRHAEIHQEMHGKMDDAFLAVQQRHDKLEGDLRKQDEDLHKEVNDRVDGVERHHANVSKESSKRMNALDLRISGLQGASGEAKRDIGKLRDEVNSLTVKSAAHDVDIGKSSDDIRKLERQRAEDNQRAKQDMDAVYEELDQKVYEKNFQQLEDNVTKLTRGTVKLAQVVGVFPGARMNDGTDEELDVDVELLNWEDCAQNLTGRVEKTWRQLSSQKYRSILDLVSKKADHSVLRLLQISQQHIESQLDRVRHERELWKEVVDKRAQQPLQLALTLKDPHTGMPLAGPGYGGGGGMPPSGFGGFGAPSPGFGTPRQLGDGAMPEGRNASMGPPLPMGPGPMVGPTGSQGDQAAAAMKASPLAKRIARPSAGLPPPAKA